MRSSLYTLMSLAAAMSLGLAACTGGGQADPNQSPAADGSATPAAGESADEKESDDTAKASAKAEAAKAPDQLAKKDFATWSLPTDNYLRFDFLLFQQGQQVALKQCLTEKQVAVEVPPVTYDPAQSQAIYKNLKDFSIYSPEFAQVHGYRPPMVVEGNRAFQEFMTGFATSGDLNQTLAISQCIIDQSKQHHFLNPLPPTGDESEGASLPENPEQIQDSSLLDDANMGIMAMKTPEVQAAAAKWKECMAPVGITDLPEQPQLMPPPSKAMEWFTTSSPLTGEPGEAERQVAVHDAQCRQSSGYSEAMYNALYAAYEEDLKTNKDRYLKRQQLMKERETALKQFIADHQ